MMENQSNANKKKTLFITGGNGEIGSAIVAKFQKAGYQVIAPKSSELNLADKNSIDAYFQAWRAGNADAIIHCAGVNVPKHLEKLDWEDLEKTMQINAFSLVKIL